MINYYLLTKPGIIFGNLVTLAAGFLLASKGIIHLKLFLATLLGLGFIIASACVLNNYIDRKTDKKMKRTEKRALATGLISGSNAISFAIFLALVGNFLLFVYTNGLTVLTANIGFFVYVLLYSLWKGHTIYGTAIGSIAGAIPPVVGYTAVKNELDLGAFILFTMMVLWQMPHFFSVALVHFDDYVKAEIPVLPIKKGIFRTKVHMVLYIIGFLLSSLLLTFFHYTGYLYLIVATTLSLAWLLLSFKGFRSDDDHKWGIYMFRLSLITIITICFVIPFDVI